MPMKAAGSRPRKPIPKHKTPKQKKRIDEQLDDALDKTFPASDPPAMIEPSPPPRGDEVW
jgi:hypothetical protein